MVERRFGFNPPINNVLSGAQKTDRLEKKVNNAKMEIRLTSQVDGF